MRVQTQLCLRNFVQQGPKDPKQPSIARRLLVDTVEGAAEGVLYSWGSRGNLGTAMVLGGATGALQQGYEFAKIGAKTSTRRAVAWGAAGAVGGGALGVLRGAWYLSLANALGGGLGGGLAAGALVGAGQGLVQLAFGL